MKKVDFVDREEKEHIHTWNDFDKKGRLICITCGVKKFDYNPMNYCLVCNKYLGFNKYFGFRGCCSQECSDKVDVVDREERDTFTYAGSDNVSSVSSPTRKVLPKSTKSYQSGRFVPLLERLQSHSMLSVCCSYDDVVDCLKELDKELDDLKYDNRQGSENTTLTVAQAKELIKRFFGEVKENE